MNKWKTIPNQKAHFQRTEQRMFCWHFSSFVFITLCFFAQLFSFVFSWWWTYWDYEASLMSLTLYSSEFIILRRKEIWNVALEILLILFTINFYKLFKLIRWNYVVDLFMDWSSSKSINGIYWIYVIIIYHVILGLDWC